MTLVIASTLPEADRHHRQEFMEFCITSAHPSLRATLVILYEHFQAWNHTYFGDVLFPPHFLILNPKTATAEGDYSPVSGWGSRSQIRIRPSLIDGSHPHLIEGSENEEGIERYWLDVALHEVIHQYCEEVLERPENAEKGHGRIFAEECSRVGALMGLPPVGPARKSRNKQNLPTCAFWPTNVRQPTTEAYYLGAYRPDLAPKRKGKGAPAADLAAPGAPGIDDEADDEAEPSIDTGPTTNPLSPMEWSQLFAIAAEVAEARPLITRLARHHNVVPTIPVVMMPPRPPATPLRTPAASAPAMPPLPSPMPSTLASATETSTSAPVAPAGGDFVPSSYQQAIFDFVQHGQGDGLVDACAGAGKTSTLIHAARLITRGDALFVAFNRHIAEELKDRLKGTRMVAKTIHSIGHGCVTRRLEKVQKPDERKYQKLCRAYVDGRWSRWEMEDQRKATEALGQLVNFCRLTLTNPSDRPALRGMIEHFGIDVDPQHEAELLPAVAEIIDAGIKQAEREKIIDFTDMVYLPWRWQLQPPRVDFLMIDECQDLNAAQLDLVLKCRAPGGRLLAVGDPNQAIYAFSGADSRSFWKIQEKTGAILLPLSICYRCPSSHLDLARQIVPHIEARPGAPVGVIGDLKIDELPSQVQAGDMILCRLTAPLVKTCIKLIEHRIPAQVRGRDIGKALTDIVEAVAKSSSFTYEEFGTHLNHYAERQRMKISQRPNPESALESFNDRVEAVRTCYGSSSATSAKELVTQIDELFSDADAVVLLSTVHRAKGLENDRIFILRPDALPLEWPRQKDWEAEQEMNLKYVALTRAKKELYFVHDNKQHA